jgi:hypothetical protein
MKKVIEHKIELETSVKVILAVLAIGVFMNVFAPAFTVREAFAEMIGGSIDVNVSSSSSGFKIWCEVGCN